VVQKLPGRSEQQLEESLFLLFLKREAGLFAVGVLWKSTALSLELLAIHSSKLKP